MKEKLINDAIQYVQDNNLAEEVCVIIAKIIADTGITDVLNVTIFVCVSIYINDKYINNEK